MGLEDRPGQIAASRADALGVAFKLTAKDSSAWQSSATVSSQ